MKLFYLVHDVSDTGVARRIDLLNWGGCTVRLAGFRRTDEPRATVHGAPVVDLGRTGDGSAIRRLHAVLRHWLGDARLRSLAGDADVVVAREPEMLTLATRIRRPGMRLVYECLDAGSAAGRGLSAAMLRRLEAHALGGVDLVVTNRPGGDRYWHGRGYRGAVLPVENKVPALDGPASDVHLPALPHEGSWVIGWFGNLRCRRSWQMLRTLVDQGQGRIEVLVAGRPDPAVFGDLAGLAATPGIRFAGSYAVSDLPALYASAHFSWVVDFDDERSGFAQGLPDRLYESLAHRSVPIALASSAAGEWLARRGAGVLLDSPATRLAALLGAVGDAEYATLLDAIGAIPPDDYLMGPDEGRAVVAAITGHE